MCTHPSKLSCVNSQPSFIVMLSITRARNRRQCWRWQTIKWYSAVRKRTCPGTLNTNAGKQPRRASSQLQNRLTEAGPLFRT